MLPMEINEHRLMREYPYSLKTPVLQDINHSEIKNFSTELIIISKFFMNTIKLSFF